MLATVLTAIPTLRFQAVSEAKQIAATKKNHDFAID
jgi:hypothetical protein